MFRLFHDQRIDNCPYTGYNRKRKGGKHMDVVTKITVPDYVYEFYKKVAENITHASTEETMSRALFGYAGFLAEKMEQEDGFLTEPTSTN